MVLDALDDNLTSYKLAPIFTRTPPSPPKKRQRLAVNHYFQPATPTRPKRPADDSWTIPRRRTGLGAFRAPRLDTTVAKNYCGTLHHDNGPFQPGSKPNVILLPSIHPPTGRVREYAPVLAVATSHAAKAACAGHLAVAGEEGGVRIVPLHEEADHAMEKGAWWRAHANAIFGVAWSEDDTRLLTSAGDTTSRVHQLDASGPRLVASLRGHTASVKTATFCGPNQVASASRDGSILIYDTRSRGRADTQAQGYSAGIPGFAPQEIDGLDPVLTLKRAHSATKSIVSVTSLVALSTMPGLASGGSGDGIVKIWDLRSVGAIDMPDPTVVGPHASRRPRGINSIVESPTTGDLYVLTGDSRIHSMRRGDILGSYADSALHVSSFFCKLAISPDGQHLAAGSGKGNVVTFETSTGKSLALTAAREVGSVDWGVDTLVATSDDYAARIWRHA